ncbi:MAG: serine dehydratase subunit alpha family protein [Telmatospirillum sp.]|nr:serine dehydratase subunit alpha family protein [Telmatospirillum sp.]
MIQDSIVELLKEEVVPASGCTEPGAVALATACASAQMQGPISSIHVTVNPNIYKNGVAVGIPGTGRTGIPLAAALGAIKRHPERQLLVLADVTAAETEAAQRMIDDDIIKIDVDTQKTYLWIKAVVQSGGDCCEVVIDRSHTNISSIRVNGIPSLGKKQTVGDGRHDSRAFLYADDLTLASLIEAIEGLPLEKIEFLKNGITLNLHAAELGLTQKRGMGLGRMYAEMAGDGVLADDPVTYARMVAAAAADVRMSGEDIKIMSSAGSGNHGITAILPVYAAGRKFDIPDDRLIRAIAISHLITIYVKIHTGSLSALCGCSVAAATGATAAIAWMLGGSMEEIAAAMTMIVANLTGMICDGGKVGCALKLATASGAAVESALLARRHVSVPATNGIVATTIEQTIRNLGQVANPGMLETDKVVLDIMLSKDAAAARSESPHEKQEQAAIRQGR